MAYVGRPGSVVPLSEVVGDFDIADGDLRLLTAGKGIDFSGVGTVAEILDDYEYGEWTPNISTGTLGASNGGYAKIGRVVHAWGRIYNPSDITSAVDVKTDLPFSSSMDGGVPYAIGSVEFRRVDDAGFGGTILGAHCKLDNGFDNLFFAVSRDGTTTDPITVQHNDLGSFAFILFHVTYTVSA